jgi:hypothetical protein
LAELFGSLLWDMLFAMAVEGRWWWVGLCEFGLCVGYSCMVGNMAKGIYGSWTSILNGSWSVGTKVDLMMMIAMFHDSEMYD